MRSNNAAWEQPDGETCLAVIFIFFAINNINNNYQYCLLTKGISSGKI
ncbi:hypothetical protein CLOBOL_00275 [Enterocloster bolteae ATCC BAA-613]|uniref:Uncharacterized protein n=1 Tax=Enterocloster bolteae (strain ATCC BAA-613 / DSM 15670 / CCUG 46953 / JCM 12243 / WAL 16351) TaxID=411902 RepID=A8RH02_ENTBW|nr:hypothetical protein CLOBOL_00275 [Enterocloster bolteae ATCC BAA-613]